MASISIHNWSNEESERHFQLHAVNLNKTINDLKRIVSEKVSKPAKDIELVYCGQCLHADRSLESYGIRSGSTIYVLKKYIAEASESEKMNETEVQQVMTALRMALLNTGYRATVEKMLTDPEILENLITATPGLEKDSVVLAMFQDPELLAIMSHPHHIYKVMAAHPTFGHVALVVAAIVNEEGSKSGDIVPSTASYSLDQMSDDEDLTPPPLPPRGQSPAIDAAAQGITASQLAAALAAATTPQSSSAEPPPTSTADGNSITSDFFQQAMAQAQTSATRTQLEQLQDMGITDEALALQALQEAGGDLQGALEYIFGDGGM